MLMTREYVIPKNKLVVVAFFGMMTREYVKGMVDWV